MQKLLFIEPHPDDAALSSYFHLKAWKLTHDIHLMSVGNMSHIKRSSKTFCDSLGITYIDAPMINDIFYADHRIPHPALRKVEHPYLYQHQHYMKHHLMSFYDTVSLIEEYGLPINPDVVVTALGIYHPMHVITRAAVDSVFKDTTKRYFVDMPYRFKKFGQRILEDYGKKVVSALPLMTPTEEEVKEKLSVFKRCYPTEVGILRFDSEGFSTYHEEVTL